MDAYHVFSQHLSWRSSCCNMWSGCPGQKPFSFSPGSPTWWKGGGIEKEVGRLSERCRFPTSSLTPSLHEAEFATSGHLLRAFKPAPGNAGEHGHVPFLQSCAVLPSQGTFQKWRQIARSCSLSSRQGSWCTAQWWESSKSRLFLPQTSASHLQTPTNVSFFIFLLLSFTQHFPAFGEHIPGRLQEPAVSFQD